ncbi:Fungalysin metallopeptidase-domain-containing protein [Infundibulicybe gibba]|nr:Fungalysin metallopeptidase-domain-containing protein [Infundibulicybe gibba]
MPPSSIFLGLILLAITCPLVSGRSRIAYPAAFDESRITSSKSAGSRPWTSNESRLAPSKYATHDLHVVGNGRRLESFHPPTTFKTLGDGIDPPQSFGLGPATLKEIAVAVTQSQLGINPANIRFQSGFSEGQTHMPMLGSPTKAVVSFGSSFVETSAVLANITASAPSLNVQSVIPSAENALNGKFNGHPPTLEYLVQSDGSIALTYVVQIQNNKTGTWFEAFMDAHSGDILSVTDFVARASYKAVPITKDFSISRQVTLVDPQDPFSSPSGWHNPGPGVTAGNNVVVFRVRGGRAAATPETGTGLVFDYTYVDTLSPTTGQNLDAARTNAFYVMNAMHDITYQYGFREISYNFQMNNFGRGGRERDPIHVQVHDDSNTNDAVFATPPDGQPGICRLYLWDRTSPRRDAAMDNSVLIHEFTHGLTRRMVGGGIVRCSRTMEARGLSTNALDSSWVQQRPILPRLPLQNPTLSLPDYTYGRYLVNSIAGMRTYPYSTSEITNPLRYSSIKTLHEVHDIGEVWANMLHNVHAALVREHGFSRNAKTDPTTPEGNVVFMRLFMSALSILPCSPTFLYARDAWIQADYVIYGGANRCLLWKVFASRGLGVDAGEWYLDNSESSAVPPDCRPTII